MFENNYSLIIGKPTEKPNIETVVSRIELKHVMNTYTNYQPSNINNQFNFEQTPVTNGNQFSPPIGPFGSSLSSPNTDNNFSPPMMLPPPFMMNGYVPNEPPPLQQIHTTTNRPNRHPTTPPSVSTNQDVNNICGTRYSETEIAPFIFGGEDTQRGDWPWMVAIYLNKATGLSFNCGGSLISSKAVVTAAHCINTSTKNYRAHEVVLYLGRYSLIDWSEQGIIVIILTEHLLRKANKINFIFIRIDSHKCGTNHNSFGLQKTT